MIPSPEQEQYLRESCEQYADGGPLCRDQCGLCQARYKFYKPKIMNKDAIAVDFGVASFTTVLENHGVKIVEGEYYHLPYWFKKINDTTYEIIRTADLPKHIKEIINPCNL